MTDAAMDGEAPGSGPRPGGRDNGLQAPRYIALADLDPRVAEALLNALRDNGIAAYVVPTPGSHGGYLENRLPSTPSQRLWVGEGGVERARELLAAEQRDPVPAGDDEAAEAADLDAAWKQVLASLQSTPDTPVPPWPVSEDLDINPRTGDPSATGRSDVAGDEDEAAGPPELDEHYVPPAPPPLPHLRPTTLFALLAIVVGILILATGFDDGDLTWLGILCVVGGGGALVWNMKDGPPTDSGWDDGAVV